MMQMTGLILQLEYSARILLAAVCGACIGYERTNRLKTAGIRTHVIVSLAAALMMIISKYGFSDILAVHNVGLDPSRIAAGVVTAIGFLGAGIIFVHNQSVSGLTTAAGIWATVGVGMSVGGGQCLIGIFSTILLIIVQWVLHRDFKWIKTPTVEVITLKLPNGPDAVKMIQETIREESIEILNISVQKIGNESIKVRLDVKLPDSFDMYDAIQRLLENENIESIDI